MQPDNPLQPEPSSEPPYANLVLVGQLTASTSHRINNLLHRINSGEFLVDSGIQAGDVGKISRGWAIVKLAQARITLMMTNLLFFSQNYEPFRRSSSPKHIIEIAKDRLTDAFGEGDFLVHHGTADGCELELDSHHSGIAIQNIVSLGLIGNDDKDENTKCRVQLATGEYADGFSLQFRFDALDEDINLASLLESKVQTEKAERGKLELLVAKKIVEAHGGSITINSAAPNTTTVEVILPKA